MASSVATTFHSAADGEQFTAAAFRLGAASHAVIVNDAVDALKSRSGIVPGAGSPLDVTQLVTPVMKVTVKKGTVVQQSVNATGGVYSHSLTADTDLDVATAHATNPRLDCVVATVFDDGTSASNTKVEVLTGMAAASPSLPAELSSPPANTHYFPLAQVRVEAAVTSIVAAKITKPAFGALVMGQFTAGVGGVVRGVNREWSAARVTTDSIDNVGTQGQIIGVAVPSGEALPGVYLVMTQATININGTVGSSHSTIYFDLESPDGTRSMGAEVVSGYAFCASPSCVYVNQGYGTSLSFALKARCIGTNGATLQGDPPSRIQVIRVADL